MQMYNTLSEFADEYIEEIMYTFQYESSELKWCEFEYTHSSYIVEFWNALTSLSLFLVGLYGLYSSSKFAKKFYVLLMFIGLSSFYFHTTLSFAGQLLDELGITFMMLMANYTVYIDDVVGLWIITTFGILQLLIQFTHSEYNSFVLFLYAVLFVNKFWLALTSRDRKTRWYAHITIGLFFMSVVCWICDFYICGKDTLFNFHGIWHVLIALTTYFTIETCLLLTKKAPTLSHYNTDRANWFDFYEQ